MLIIHFTDGLDILYITLGLDTVRSEAPTVKFAHTHTHTPMMFSVKLLLLHTCPAAFLAQQ